MSLLTYKEFIEKEIEVSDEISDIEDVLPDPSVVIGAVSGRIFSFEDYYSNNKVTYPNYTINTLTKKEDGKK